jgi:phosphoserine phosphatase
MEGRITFVESFKQRVRLLKGLEATKTWENLSKRISFTMGCKDLAKEITQRGCHSAIVSGGFTPIVDYARETLNFEYCKANDIEVANDRFTGETNNEIVDGALKQAVMKSYAVEKNVSADLVQYYWWQ